MSLLHRGILKHAPALLALIAPSTNSYKRLVPGYEAPINLVYSQRNRSACIRIPVYSKSEGAKRIEFRTPDPTCNPYLSFAACMMAGLDGVANKIDPGKPVDKDLYELPAAEQKKIKQLPGSLDIVLDNLEKSHDWLLKGDVFTADLIETWIEYKRKNEVDPIRLRPHPWSSRSTSTFNGMGGLDMAPHTPDLRPSRATRGGPLCRTHRIRRTHRGVAGGHLDSARSRMPSGGSGPRWDWRCCSSSSILTSPCGPAAGDGQATPDGVTRPGRRKDAPHPA